MEEIEENVRGKNEERELKAQKEKKKGTETVQNSIATISSSKYRKRKAPKKSKQN